MRALQGWARCAVVATVLVAPAVASAATNVPESGFWMAVSGSTPTVGGTNWGRLILKDGVLTFYGSLTEWKLAVAEIKRVTVSEGSDRLIEVESFAGDRYYIAILDANLLVDSPRKAMQIIHRALRSAAAASRRE